MEKEVVSVMIMAGGTGGHVFPGLAVARTLRDQGVGVVWLGTRSGLEARTVPQAGFEIEWINIQGLRSKGLLSWLLLPWRLLLAMVQAIGVFRRRRPAVVLSMGGFVAGPGALVARLFGKPLLVHESNAIPGLTNRFLAYFARYVLCGFPDSFANRPRVRHVGNPVRSEILALGGQGRHDHAASERMHLLIIGGSQGAQIFNELVPPAIARLPAASCPDVRHQCGRNNLEQTRSSYRQHSLEAAVSEFVDDMAEAYSWADLVLCRAGAMTVSELATVGLASILVPFPYAVDDHQTANARYLAEHDAAILMPQAELSIERLQQALESLATNRDLLNKMAQRARACAMPDATETVAQYCLEAANA